MTASEIINKYISFFEQRGHKRIENAPLVPLNDPTTLFTSSGMQPLVPYLLGEAHPEGKRLVNVQNCFRAQDIEEIGDNRHTTFFRMLGNWSLGDYFKSEQLEWFFDFLTDKQTGLGINPQRLYVTVFAGDRDFKQSVDNILAPLGPDLESIAKWKELFKKHDIDAQEIELGSVEYAATVGMQGKRIFMYDSSKNWWSRSGTPDKMPLGEPGGPDSEVFYEFENIPHDERYGKYCHPNCDCGRFVEIGNSVFMQYKKRDEKTFELLPNQNVDFGGGLERLAAAINNDPDMFRIDSFHRIITSIRESSGRIVDYDAPMFEAKHYYPRADAGQKITTIKDSAKNISLGIHSARIIADHINAAVFLLSEEIIPSNKERGYVLRRLIRRAILYGRNFGINKNFFSIVAKNVIIAHKDVYPHLIDKESFIIEELVKEETKFRNTLDNGLKVFERYITANEVGKPETKVKLLSPKDIFFLYESYGFPYELTKEEADKRGITIPSREEFDLELQMHKNQSRTASAGMFKGGLMDHQERTVMGHTATHLLQQALRDVLGDHVFQTGSNITTERLRFDFSHPEKLTDEQIQQVESIVNGKIQENLPVYYLMLPLKKAKELGAIGLFDEKYQEQVKVYCMGSSPEHPEKAYSKEFCGGPHVDFTSKVKSFKITKQENIGNKQRRVYAVVG